jgi:hypothetical protein
MQNSTGTLFDNQNINPGDILVKYTYVGDANLDGKVDASDYSRIDNGYLNQLTGWANGDFNYDGVVNGSDYTLIDNAFNMQAEPLAEIAPLGAETQPRTARVRLFAGNHLASPALQTVPQNTDVAQGTILDSDFSGDDILNSIRAKRRLFSQTRF